MMKKLIILVLLVLGLSLSTCSFMRASIIKKERIERIKKIEQLREWIMTKPSKYHFDTSSAQEDGLSSPYVLFDEEDISKCDFKWRFNYHVLEYASMGLRVCLDEYQRLVTPGEQVVSWHLWDIDGDGMVDVRERSFGIFTPDDIFDEFSYYHLLCPRYPYGLLNPEWFNPSREVAQNKFDEELDYWIERMEREGI